MKYNWHQIAEKGPLPQSFRRHALICTSTSNTTAYAVGTDESAGGNALEIFQLDCKLEEWTKLRCSYESSTAQQAVSIQRHGHAVASVGSAIYIIGGTCSKAEIDLLKFDTTKMQWSLASFSGGPRGVSSCTAATLGSEIVLFGVHRNNEPTNDIYIVDTLNGVWICPKVSGVPPTPRSDFSAIPVKNERLLLYGGASDRDAWCLELETPYTRRYGGEVVAWSKCKRGTVPLVICGPSGVGKGTLITRLMKEFPDKFGFSVSHTTRKPREKEIDRVHYHFTNREEMERQIQDGKFLEYANVHGNIYGTSIAAVEDVADAGKCCILDIDVQGARSVRQSSMPALFIFIAPPSFEELERRLRGRGTETEEQITRRLDTAKKELELGKAGALFDHVLVNADLEATLQQLKLLLGLTKEETAITHLSDSSKLLVMNNGMKLGHKLCIVDPSSLVGGAPNETQGVKWIAVEPSDKQVPSEYTNHVSLSNIEILLTGDQNRSIVLRLGK